MRERSADDCSATGSARADELLMLALVIAIGALALIGVLATLTR